MTTPRAVYRDLPLQLAGRFQRDNLAVAVAGAEMLRGEALDLRALAAAVARVRMPGPARGGGRRAPDRARRGPQPRRVEALVASLPEVLAGRRPAVAVVSVLDDKDAGAMLNALAPFVDRILVTRSGPYPGGVGRGPRRPRRRASGSPPERSRGRSTRSRAARCETGPDGVVLVTGSLYLLVDLRRYALGEGAHSPC